MFPTRGLICKNRTCSPELTQHAEEVGDILWQDGRHRRTMSKLDFYWCGGVVAGRQC